MLRQQVRQQLILVAFPLLVIIMLIKQTVTLVYLLIVLVQPVWYQCKWVECVERYGTVPVQVAQSPPVELALALALELALALVLELALALALELAEGIMRWL